MAYIATLKKNNTVIYPQTKSTAVYEDDGVTPIDDVVVKKSTAVADANKMIKADGAKSLVGASNIDFTTLPGNYSTSEINTGFTWVDGKNIYKKTIDCGAMPNATTKSVNHGISNLYRVLKVEGYAYDPSGTGTMVPLPMPSTDQDYNIQVAVKATVIEFANNANRSNYSESYVTLYYTKNS